MSLLQIIYDTTVSGSTPYCFGSGAGTSPGITYNGYPIGYAGCTSLNAASGCGLALGLQFYNTTTHASYSINGAFSSDYTVQIFNDANVNITNTGQINGTTVNPTFVFSVYNPSNPSILSGTVNFIFKIRFQQIGNILDISLTNTNLSTDYQLTGYIWKICNFVFFDGYGSDAQLTANLNSGSVSSISNIWGGMNYPSAPKVHIYGDGAGATATTTIDGSGIVNSIVVNNGGSGYTVANIALATFTTQATITATIGTIVVNEVTINVVNGLSITAEGLGYVGTVTLIIYGGGGTGATGTVTINGSGSITAVSLTGGGTGYTSVPTVIITSSIFTSPNGIQNIGPFGPNYSLIDFTNNTSVPDAGVMAIIPKNYNITTPFKLFGYGTSQQTNNYAVIVSSYNNYALNPGNTDTFGYQWRFAPAGSTIETLASDYATAYAAAYPSLLNWQDRRSIISTFPGSAGNLGFMYDKLYGLNQNGTSTISTSVDGGTPYGSSPYLGQGNQTANFELFRAALLTHAQTDVATALAQNAQGIITWDIETDSPQLSASSSLTDPFTGEFISGVGGNSIWVQNGYTGRDTYIGDIIWAYDVTPALAYITPNPSTFASWSNSTTYANGNYVTAGGNNYVCTIGHTSKSPTLYSFSYTTYTNWLGTLGGENYPISNYYWFQLPPQSGAGAMPYSGLTILQDYFNTHLNAGLRAGITLRGGQYVWNNGYNPYHIDDPNSPSYSNPSDFPDPNTIYAYGDSLPEFLIQIINRIEYARDNFGVTIFYIDSLPALINDYHHSWFDAIATAVPDVLLCPEEQTVATYRSAIGYCELRGGCTGTPPWSRFIWPNAGQLIEANNAGDGNDITTVPTQEILLASITAGDILLASGYYCNLVYSELPPTIGISRQPTATLIDMNTINLSTLGVYSVDNINTESNPSTGIYYNGSPAELTYTWSVVETPPGTVVFSNNGTNTSRNSVATIHANGEYVFSVALTGPSVNISSSCNIAVSEDFNIPSLIIASITNYSSASAIDLSVINISGAISYNWNIIGLSSSDFNFSSNNSTSPNSTLFMLAQGKYTVKVVATGLSPTTLETIIDVNFHTLTAPSLSENLLPSSVNTVVTYAENNTDSYNFALYYANIHGLDNTQIIGLPCSNDEILDSYSTFRTQIEVPLLNAIENEYIADLKVVIVGYGVPGGFYDGDDTVSTTSRISRIFYPYSKGFSNPLFNRQQFHLYDDADASTALIASRIDAPDLQTAMSIVDNAQIVTRKSLVDGTLYFDPYAPIVDSQEQDYQNDLFFFQSQVFPELNIPEYVTTFWDATTNVLIPQLSDDSFMWAWKANRAGYTFFEDTTSSRIFLYNADIDGGASLRDADDKRWPVLALSSGYIGTAGSMSDPLPEGFLRPAPFFQALLQGATVGEAFVFSCPNLDWTVTLFGDPLVKVKFPNSVNQETNNSLPISLGWTEMGLHLQNAVSYYLCRENASIDAYNGIALSGDVQTVTTLLSPISAMANEIIAETTQDLGRLISAYINFLPLTTSLSDYMMQNNLQISQLLGFVDASFAVSSSLLYPTGWWLFEDIIQNSSTSFLTYQFEIDVSSDVFFANILFSINSSNSIQGWYYEQTANTFVAIPSTGITSSYAGQTIQYISQPSQYLTTSQIIYIRFKQIDEFGNSTGYRYYQQVIGT